MEQEIREITERVKEKRAKLGRLFEEIERVIVGQKYMVERLIVGLLANGHVLVEGVPGLAKTTAVKTLAHSINTRFQRLQFTPDLLPADLIGTQIYIPGKNEFAIKRGPIFSNIILADEINRAPAKVQSALLEAMQERQVTIGENTFSLDEPFLVMATQNPIEQEGTYPLPEAQVDRFMLKIKLDYPSKLEEKKIVERMARGGAIIPEKIMDPKEIFEMRALINQIYVDKKVEDYIVDIVFATREPDLYGLKLRPFIQYGASPRASIYLHQAGRVMAFLNERGYVTPNDIKLIAPDVLRHRIIVSYEAEAEDMTADHIVKKILDSVEVP